MKRLGNISGIVYTSYPEQWDDVYICESCKTKKTVRESGNIMPSYNLDGYKDNNSIKGNSLT